MSKKTRNEVSRLRMWQRAGASVIVFAAGYSMAYLGPTWYNVGFFLVGLWLILTRRLVVGY